MENASKALLIAGGVLITMIVASFGVYLYGVYHEHSENMLAAMSEKEISQFNAKFLVYEDRELTANDVVSIMNLVRDNNLTKAGSAYQIRISTDGWEYQNSIIDTKGLGAINNVIMEKDEKKYNEICNSFFSKTLENNLYNFKCKVYKYSKETGLVSDLSITHQPITN